MDTFDLCVCMSHLLLCFAHKLGAQDNVSRLFLAPNSDSAILSIVAIPTQNPRLIDNPVFPTGI